MARQLTRTRTWLHFVDPIMGYRFIGTEIHGNFYQGTSPFKLFSEIGVRPIFLQTLESDLELSEIRRAAG
jgi:hypothetical protein